MSLTLCCKRLVHRAYTTPQWGPFTPLIQRAPRPRAHARAPELPHSSAGGARGARRHRPHVPTSPCDNVHTTSHAHTKHWIPVRVDPAPLLHPRRLCMRLWFSDTNTGTRAREHGTSLCCHARPQLGPSAPREPYSIPSKEDATHGPSKVLEHATHLRPMSHVAWSVPNPSPFSLAAVPPPFHGTAHMHVIVLMRSVCPVQGQRDRNSSSAGVEQVEQVE